MTRVFSQQANLVSQLPQLVVQGSRLFALEVEVLAASPPDRPELARANVTLRTTSRRRADHAGGTFDIEARPAAVDDVIAARTAEERGRASGMSLLAARCPSIWIITAQSDVTGTAELELSALLASVALGPVMPADESTLYGVRGALERAERATT